MTEPAEHHMTIGVSYINLTLRPVADRKTLHRASNSARKNMNTDMVSKPSIKLACICFLQP